MIILGVMCLGVIVGKYFFSEKHKTKNEYLQTICTALLIFAMGVTLGQKDDFFSDLLSLGFDSFLFFAIPTLFSILFVYMLTQRFLCEKKEKKHKCCKKEEQ